MKKILKKIINIIYPQTCSICGKLNSNALCSKCSKKLEKEYCFKKDNYQDDFNKNFIEHYYFFWYKDLIRSQIISLKFNERPYISQTIAYFLKKMKKSFEKLKIYDIIIVVPVSRKRRNERGYNQSELIARAISKTLGIPIVKNVLVKIKKTVPQSSLNKVQRAENSNGVYSAKNHTKLRNKKILLIDDIYTTGSTLNECANALIQKGIKREQIGVLTLAKD